MKRAITIFVLLAVVSVGAFAQLAFGFTGSLYGDMDTMKSDPDQVLTDFKNGEGLFYGPFVELGMGKLALGVSGNFSLYEEDYSFLQDGTDMIAMMDYDITGYLQLHLFKYKSFLDPFVEGGVGTMAKDYQDKTTVDTDSENPIAGTVYYQFGGGLGLNFGRIGIFAKGLYMMPIKTIEGTYTTYDALGNPIESNYSLAAYPMQNFKVTAGLKFIL
jgi:hypothetical protein